MATIKGRLKDWNEEQGIGIITVADSKDDILFELKDFIANHQPHQGEMLICSLRPTLGGRLQAFRVQPTGLVMGDCRFNRLQASDWLLAGLPFIFSLLAAIFSLIPLLAYLVFSAASMMTIYQDHNKKTGRFSVSDWQLLIAELLGGWPGSLVAQAALNHHCPTRAYQRLTTPIRYLHMIIWLITITSWMLLAH
mgnify:CR=1 FL=1